MGWANRITVARAVLTLAVWTLLVVAGHRGTPGPWWAAFAAFVVTAASDVLDGWLARRLGEVSLFGRVADPLVDKLLVLGTMCVLLGIPAVAAVMPGWAVALVLSREMVVTAVRGAIEGKGVPFGAAGWGKTKMVLQCIAVGAVILHGAGFEPAHLGVPGLRDLPGAEGSTAQALVLVAVLVTVLSGVSYVRRAVALLRDA